MGLFSFWKPKGNLSLTTSERQTIWKLFGSFQSNLFSQNDQKFLQEGYESNVDVFSVIKKIVDTSKAVPWIVEKRTGSGEDVTWEEITDTSIHELMANPNPTKGYTWDDIEEMLLIYLLTTGNNYMVGNTQINRTLIEELEILPPFAVEPKTGNDFFLPNLRYEFELGTTTKDFTQEEVEHLRFFNPGYSTIENSYVGLSPIQVAAAVVQSGNDKWDASASLFQNRGAIGLLTNKSDRPLTEDEAEKIQSAFNSQTAGSHNYGKTKVSNANMDFVQMAMSAQDLQIIEQGVVGLRAICNVYNVDSSLFNDPANKTFNNRKEAEKGLYTNAVIPLSTKISQGHTNFIAKNHFPDGSVRMRQDFSEVEALQSDQKEEADKDKSVVEGLDKIMRMPIEDESKKELIKEIYGISDDVVDKLITNTQNGTIPNQESQLRD